MSEDDGALELRKLREAAKIASIYHGNKKFERNANLSHVVHASIHCVQIIVTLVIETFHHVHHYVVQNLREEDESVPVLPEERNPIFFIYPCCVLFSVVCTVLRLRKKLLVQKPEIAMAGCSVGAVLMLLAGIMEMKHVDTYIDLTEISDEELLTHPVFIHNFVMCILSIFGMTMYLIQTWILFDYYRWMKRKRRTSGEPDEPEVSDSSADPETTEGVERTGVAIRRESEDKEQPGELYPIPSLDKFPSQTLITDHLDIEDEPVIYCCFVDCYNYGKKMFTPEPVHEFQVVHIV